MIPLFRFYVAKWRLGEPLSTQLVPLVPLVLLVQIVLLVLVVPVWGIERECGEYISND